MQVIDLEILIPASPDYIWQFLGDISRAPSWHEGVAGVSFLTTQRDGKGARWRYRRAKGGDIIIEAAAWYDTVGYEYTVVDGAKLGDNQGRIRLTEVTDGTVVRWTLEYEPSGMLGGLRNAMRFKGKATKQMQASLRNLHQLVLQESGGVSTHKDRAAVREAPDARKRSTYQPRHPSAFSDESAAADGGDMLDESTESQPAHLSPEGTLFAPQFEADGGDGDTKPNPVILGGDGFLDMQFQRGEIEDATEPVEPALVSILPEAPPEPAPMPEPAIATPRNPVDSSMLSVFEIFGLPKPSAIEDERIASPRFESVAQEQVAAPISEPTPIKLPAPEAEKSDIAGPSPGMRKTMRQATLAIRARR